MALDDHARERDQLGAEGRRGQQPPLGEDPAAERRGDGLVRLTGSSIGALLDVTQARPAAASDARWTLIAAVACQGAMVLATTILSVVRPGGRIRRRRPAPSGA